MTNENLYATEKVLKEMRIPLPGMVERQIVIQSIESLVAETQCSTPLYEQKLATLAGLKKSLLDQAFTGEL